MTVACQAIDPAGGPPCAIYGPKKAPRVMVRIGAILIPARLCEDHRRMAGLPVAGGKDP